MEPTYNSVEKSGVPLPDRGHLDRALGILQSSKDGWLETALVDRIQLLEAVIQGFESVAKAWVRLSCSAKQIDLRSPTAGEEWLAGPYTILRNLRLLKKSLLDLERGRTPQLPGKSKHVGGTWKLPVFPTDIYDRLFYSGTTAEVWLGEGANQEKLSANQAQAYRQNRSSGKISLVLSAGNVSSIGPLDAIHKLFCEKKVVLIKTHPVNGYLKPLLEKAFQALISRGFLQIVAGGAEEGSFLCHHPAIADIHITGSDRTHDAIVFGDKVAERKGSREPLLTKPITSELGNVSPVIVVPGPWSEDDIHYQAQNLVSSLANNAGFNCNATRVILTHRDWSKRGTLLDAIRDVLTRLPSRKGYYPGASERFQSFLASHPEAETYGSGQDGHIPWTFIPNLDPESKDDICFQTEAFCSVFSESGMKADSIPEFIEEAVSFANDTLWGTLNISLLVHPKSMADPKIGAAIEKAIKKLHFGTVSLNHWAGIGFVMGSTTWGAYPCHDLFNIRSGIGVVHNTYLLEHVEKTVLKGPFRAWPKPAWFVTHKKSHLLGQQLTAFEAKRSFIKVPGIFWTALRG